MEKKKVGVTLPPALHDSIKILATRLGIHVEEAYGEALQQYLAINNGADTRELSAEVLRLARKYDEARQIAGPEHERLLESAVTSIEAIASIASRPAPAAKTKESAASARRRG